MVEHVICFKLKPEVTAEQKEHFIGMLRGLKEKVPGIVDLSAGENFSPDRAHGYSVGMVIRFRDKAGLAVYGPHPDHQPVKKLVSELAESVFCVDYEF